MNLQVNDIVVLKWNQEVYDNLGINVGNPEFIAKVTKISNDTVHVEFFENGKKLLEEGYSIMDTSFRTISPTEYSELYELL